MVHVKRVERSDYGVVQMTFEATPDSGEILNMAVELIGWAIAGDPGNAFFHSDLGHAYASLDDKEKALHSFRHALVLQPDVPATHDNFGWSLCGPAKKYLNPKAFRDGEKARA